MWIEYGRYERPKNVSRGSEDGIIAFPGGYAVFDGVSSGVDPKAPTPLIGGLTPGQFARDNGMRALREALQNYTTPRALVDYMSDSLHYGCEQARLGGDDIGRPGYTFLVFLLHGVIIQVGDCAALVDDVLYENGMLVDRIKARVRRRMLREFLHKGISLEALVSNDPTKAKMDEYANWQQQYANHPTHRRGYGVINGQSVPDRLVRVYPVPVDAKRIAMATDGCPVLRHDVNETVKGLKDLLDRDPLCINEWKAVRGRQPDGNIPDDATGLWLMQS